MQVTSNFSGKRRFANPAQGSADIIAHCKNNWIPSVLYVPDSFSSGSALREFLKKNCLLDPLFCLSVTRAGVEQFGVSAEDTGDFLGTADVDSLKRLLSTAQAFGSSKNINEATPIQSRKIQQIAMAVGAARITSEKTSVNAASGFLVGALPMLGHLLYSWNYPTLYASAVSRSRKTNRPIEEFLSTMLKLTPLELSNRITRSWQITHDTQQAIEAKIAESHNLHLIQRTSRLITTTVDPHASQQEKDEFLVLQAELQEKYSIDIKKETEEFSKNLLSYVQKIHPALVPGNGSHNPLTITQNYFAFEPEVQPLVVQLVESPGMEDFLRALQSLLLAFDFTDACLFRYESKNGERLIPLITLLSKSTKRAEEIAPLGFNPLGTAVFSQSSRVFPQGVVFDKENLAITSTALVNGQFCLFYAELPQTTDPMHVAKATRAIKDCAELAKKYLEKFLALPVAEY